jgi:hypothetical protein
MENREKLPQYTLGFSLMVEGWKQINGYSRKAKL